MEKEIQKTVRQVNRDKYELEKELEKPVKLDEMCVMVYTLTMMNADKDPTDIPGESN